MKHLLLLTLIIAGVGCGSKHTMEKLNGTYIELNSGDTVAMYSIHPDTLFVHDTIIIHDTVYTSKHYGNVETVIIGGE